MDDSARPRAERRRQGQGRPAATLASGEFGQVLRLAARLVRAPIGIIRTDTTRLAWSDPALGLQPAQLAGLQGLCELLDGSPGAAVIPDATQDPRLWHHPSVAGAPCVQFVASVPITGRKGDVLGVLCVMDRRARRRLPDDQADALVDLASLAARMLERERSAEVKLHTLRSAATTEQIESAVMTAPSCEVALCGMLVTLCKQHGAASGYVGKLAEASGMLHQVCRYDAATGLGGGVARTSVALHAPHVADALQAGSPRAAISRAEGVQAEVIQPVHLLHDRFGIVLSFEQEPPGLDQIAEDVAAITRLVRPALYRHAAERRIGLLASALDRVEDAVMITEAGPLGGSGPRIVYANASFCRDTGYVLADVLGEPPGLYGPGTDPATLARLRQEMRLWKPGRAEMLNYRKDGTAFWAEIDMTPITDEAGTPTHWVCIQRDVSQRHESEAVQRRHEASFRLLFQDNPLPMVVMGQDGLAFLEANDAALQQYGLSRSAVLTKTFADLAADGSGDAHGALRADVAGTSMTHKRADGTVLEVRAFVHDTVYAGQEALLAVLWDVTDLEAVRRDMDAANEMLRERTLQLHARTEELGEAQRLARLGTWRMSVDGHRVSWSPEMYELTGMPRDSAGAAPGTLTEHVHPEDRARVSEAVATAARAGTTQVFEYRVLLPADEVRHLRAHVRPVLDDDGDVRELFGFSQDISDAKRSEQALLRNESLRALGQLTGGVAHDFNNLLTVVILNLEEAQEAFPKQHKLHEVLGSALHAAIRGSELTGQLLSYARRATLRPERVRPDEFFGALRPLLTRVLGERYELQVLLRHNGGSAMVDPAQLDSAIMNLVINARDAMAKGGTIVLETRSVTLAADSPGFADEVTPGRYVVISVGDKGEGIPPHLLTRVFEPFFTTKEAGKGSGMGLSMVYGFARQSGGHVIIDSKPGRGTTVRLYLPVAAEMPEEAGAAEMNGWHAHGLRALVVEDQDSVLQTVTRMFRQLGFKVTSAERADAALAHLAAEPPFDLLFTDVVLPGAMDGIALANEVRARTPGTRILLTSGFSARGLAAQDVEGPDTAFLMKPYKRVDLQTVLGGMFSADQ